MRNWVVAIVAAVNGLAACQMTPNKDTAHQPLNGEHCKVEMPTPKLWDGSSVSPAGENEAWVLWPNAGIKLAAGTDGTEWLVARVDVKAVGVRTALLVPDSNVEKFVAQVARGVIIGPGTFPPLPPCNIPLQCGVTAFHMAKIAVNASADAQEAALACGGK